MKFNKFLSILYAIAFILFLISIITLGIYFKFKSSKEVSVAKSGECFMLSTGRVNSEYVKVVDRNPDGSLIIKIKPNILTMMTSVNDSLCK